MSDELLCDPCQRLVRGDNPFLGYKDRWWGYNNRRRSFIHHATTESFQQALALPCGICRRIYSEFCRSFRHTRGGTFQPAPTEYECITFEEEKDADGIEEGMTISFYCGKEDVLFYLLHGKTITLSQNALPANPGFADLVPSFAANNTGSDICIEFASSQLKQCRDTHLKCEEVRKSRAQATTFMPTRVLDVGYRESSTVRLLEAGNRVASAPYIALSHCWGTSPPLRLTRTTATTFRTGIPWTDLPKTFQDAIQVTRKMQFRYLWIDSLCIVQDDPEDWQREAAHMKDVYSQAICCIAATAAKDSNIGLFFDRDPQTLKPVRLETTKARIVWQNTTQYLSAYLGYCNIISISDAIENGPLNRRAWVAQERYLSNRTIHFTQELVFWECFEHTTSEQDPKGEDIWRNANRNADCGEPMLRRLVYNYKSQDYGSSEERAKEMLMVIYQLWSEFRADYSMLSLTKDEDILVALNGIAQDVARAINDTLVAGMWQNRLIADMWWMRFSKDNKVSRPSKWRAPTWSWASIKGRLDRCNDIRTVFKDKAVVEDINVNQRPSGELIDASMMLRCRHIPIEWAQGWALSDSIEITLDDAIDSKIGDLAQDVSLVTLRQSDIDGRSSEVEGILISPSRAKAGSFERVGRFQVDSYFVDSDGDEMVSYSRVENLLQIHDRTEETIIELI